MSCGDAMASLGFIYTSEFGSVATAAGLLLSLLSIALSLYLYFKSKNTKFFEYFIVDVGKIGVDSFNFGNIYRHHPIRRSLLFVVNGGNQPIVKGDIIDRIELKGNIQNIGGRFIKVELWSNPASTKAELHYNNEDIYLDIELLRSKEIMILAIAHSYLDCCIEFEASTINSPYARRSDFFKIVDLIQITFLLMPIMPMFVLYRFFTDFFLNSTAIGTVVLGWFVVFSIFYFKIERIKYVFYNFYIRHRFNIDTSNIQRFNKHVPLKDIAGKHKKNRR